MTRPSRTHGFTLVELLVVIAIITMLAGFGIVKMQGVLEDAKKTACSANLQEIYAQLNRYQTKKGHLPNESGSAFVLAVWGDPFVEKSANNAKIFFCKSRAQEDLDDNNLEETVTTAKIHYAGRVQEKPYRFSVLDGKDASKTIIVCDKPNMGGEECHKGKCLCVLYASGQTGEIDREKFGGKDAVLAIGPESAYEPLQGLRGDEND